MELWQIIVALIQGLVEWLPISSEGQLICLASFGDVISCRCAISQDIPRSNFFQR